MTDIHWSEVLDAEVEEHAGDEGRMALFVGSIIALALVAAVAVGVLS